MITGVPNTEFLYFIADKDNKTVSVENGAIVKNALPTPLPQHPIGWKDLEISYSTNVKYWSLNKAISASLKFVGDGATILRHYKYKGRGYEEELFLIVLKWNNETGIFKKEYVGRFDLTKTVDDPLTGVTVNTAEGGLVSLLTANEAVNYAIKCNSTNPNAIPVLFDGVQLHDKLNYSAYEVDYQAFDKSSSFTLPVAYLNNEGDSVGIIMGSQSLEEISTSNTPDSDINTYCGSSANYIFSSIAATTITITGSIKLTPQTDSHLVAVIFQTSSGDRIYLKVLADEPAGVPIEIQISETISLASDEKLFLIAVTSNNLAVLPIHPVHILISETSLAIEFDTINEDSVAYGLRPLYVAQELVSKMTGGRYTAQSNFLAANNNVTLTSGSALREIATAELVTNFQDFFHSLSAIYNLGIKVVDDVLWIEPKADLYNDSTEIFDLGEVADLEILPATEYLVNNFKCGYPNQNYSERNGRYEFNTGFEFKLPVNAIKKEMNISSKYRADCFGIEFIRGKLNNKETTDDKGDNEVFLVHISDDQDADGNYLLYRENYDALQGFFSDMPTTGPGAPFNVEISPKRQLMAHYNTLSSLLYQQQGQKITFQAADKNREMKTTLGSTVVDEDLDVPVSKLGDPLFLPWIFKFKPKAPYSFATVMMLMAAGNIPFTYNGYTLYGLPIGELSVKPASKEAGEWKLLASPENNLEDLFNLSKDPLFSSEYSDNMLYITPLNPVHFVKYEYELGTKYHHKEIFDDWVHNRNDRFQEQPHYFQKWQNSDDIRLQVITANLGVLKLKVYDANAEEVEEINFTAITNPAVNTPYALQQAIISLTDYDEGEYIIVIFSGATPLAISEWQQVKTDHENTYYIEYYNTSNVQDTYFTGSSSNWRPSLRIEAMFGPWQPSSKFSEYEDESANTEMLAGTQAPKRKLFIGTAKGMPEWASLKMDAILLLNRVKIENDYYTRSGESKLEANDIPGYPFYHSTVEIKKQFNINGLTINDSDVEKPAFTYSYTLDAQAFGGATGTIDIEIENE